MLNFHKSFFALFFLFVIIVFESSATHNRAGEITYKYIDGKTYEITVTTYTDPESPPDRPSLTVNWGDGSTSDIQRQRIDADIGEENQHPVQRNVYVGKHTYNSPGTYTIRMRDQNRVKNIVNMTNSVNTAFYVESKLTVFPEGLGNNNSPDLLQPPIDYAQTKEVFVHYPNAYDVDGDSLVYSLVPPKRKFKKEVNGYYKPYATNEFSIDPNNGRLEWDTPDSTGVYNIAIKVSEYRDGEKIGEVIRDMQIIVSDGNNKKPKLEPFKDTCVEAGQDFKLNIPVKAVDTNPNQTYLPHEITLSATGGPFIVDSNKASFNEKSSKNTVSSQFSWEISCNHIRKFPYRVVFKAKDDHQEVPLADLKHINIKVVGPSPENLTSEPEPKGIQLDWDLPSCENVRGFKVYRRVDTSDWSPDYCENGIPDEAGYKLIKTMPGKDKTSYFDKEVVPGAVYCYRVTGLYRNEGRYNLVEGYASNETCDRLKKDVPVITHVDVQETNKQTGRIFVDWSKPVEVDSNTYEPPYKYEIYNATGKTAGNENLVKTVKGIGSYQELVSNTADTILYDSNLNTTDNAYSYNIKFYGSNESEEVLIGTSRVNSSIYLNIKPGHKNLQLNWDENVLWENQQYVIFKKHFDSSQYRVYDTTSKQKYSDTGLVKDSTYCYFVKSIGQFTAPNFPKPIINRSQKNCNEPIDTVAPCPPEVSAQERCNMKENIVQWNKPICEKDSSISGYHIYFRDHKGKSFKKLKTIKNGDVTRDVDSRDTLEYSLAGCYAVSAFDPYENESKLSNFVCVENCPKYKLPNAFTPNGDGINDFFRPEPGWQFIKRVNFRVYNRWGNIVYKTEDPAIQWDGKDYKNGGDLPAGSYYYQVEVFEIRLDGLKSKTLSGTIHLKR